MDGEIMHCERNVGDMTEAIKKLQKTLTQCGRIDEIFEVEGCRKQDNGEMLNFEEIAKASFEEIEKMDAILRAKATEEREAKIYRIQLEEESRDILLKLPRVELSNGLNINMEEFIRLLNNAEEAEHVPDYSNLLTLKRVIEVDEEKEAGNGGKERKKEKKNSERRKTNNWKFIEKNIRLAKCGRGTLSLTDEEKHRIEKLLSEADEGNNIGGLEAPSLHSKELYVLDDETKSLLSRIDRKLESAMKVQSSPQIRKAAGLSEQFACEESVCEKSEKCSAKKKAKVIEKKRRSRLVEIDRLLSQINSVCHEEIIPPSEEEIERLLNESEREQNVFEKPDRREKNAGVAKEKKNEWENVAETNAHAYLSVKDSEDAICALVSNAKLLMPKFKYRFDDS